MALDKIDFKNPDNNAKEDHVLETLKKVIADLHANRRSDIAKCVTHAAPLRKGGDPLEEAFHEANDADFSEDH